MARLLGAIMVVMALVLAVAPVFTDCESAGRMLTVADGRSISMKCHWTGIAEIGAAVPLAIAGFYVLGGRRKETMRMAGVVGMAAGAMAILLPAVLIGTCANATMPCNLLMKPILFSGGILAMAASAGTFALAREPQMSVVPAAL